MKEIVRDVNRENVTTQKVNDVFKDIYLYRKRERKRGREVRERDKYKIEKSDRVRECTRRRSCHVNLSVALH